MKRLTVVGECLHQRCIPAQTLTILSALKTVLTGQHFLLAGGTALTLYLGHRISADLDFFSEQPFSTDQLYRRIEHEGLQPVVIQEDESTLTCTVAETKVSFFHYPYPFIDEKTEWEGVELAGVLDIAAMKMIAVAQRGAKRDFVDLYFVARDVPFRKIAENAVHRFGPNRINPVHMGKSLVYFSDAELDPDPQYCCADLPSWNSIKQFFTKSIHQLVFDLQRAKEIPAGE
ncbi:MAG TPA: nucleotidyl transferase AbiEii/AbiGii toxin family protein [Thermodesulfobacteriota bacterium]|nr:nucleotidyl transferase AbiEii/AbiGii toxin family protein [Deltaproteobacteria bacterium]HOC37784.1 nucleotidyl transferase AbiEii/AbiGii toxin family protein [Thermodesulfobacteriota bacterium]